MHTYSMRDCPREHHIFYVSFAALSTLAIVNQIAGYLGVVAGVGSVAFFTAFFFAFDRYLWRFKGIATLIGIPDLAGTWRITGATEGADGVPRDWSGEARIEQTWSKIAISLETEGSRSRSAMASLARDAGHGYRVIYGYANTRKDTGSELLSHEGTCELIFSPDLTSAQATYFNDHQRRTCGTMTWKRVITEEQN